jgi:hypothetical protein
MAMICMVCAVRDPPAMVWDQDGAVGNVTHKIIQVAAVAEALVAAERHITRVMHQTSHVAIALV